MSIRPSPAPPRSTASSRNMCTGATIGIGIGTAATGAGTTAGIAVTGDGIATIAGTVTAGEAIEVKEKPRASGVFAFVGNVRLSERTATSITPAEADGANALADDDGPFDHDSTGGHNHRAAIGTASAIGAAMHAGAASALGVGGAKACDGTGNQNCCEKVFHVLSLHRTATGPVRLIQI
jgi:hypothetical protein